MLSFICSSWAKLPTLYQPLPWTWLCSRVGHGCLLFRPFLLLLHLPKCTVLTVLLSFSLGVLPRSALGPLRGTVQATGLMLITYMQKGDVWGTVSGWASQSGMHRSVLSCPCPRSCGPQVYTVLPQKAQLLPIKPGSRRDSGSLARKYHFC